MRMILIRIMDAVADADGKRGVDDDDDENDVGMTGEQPNIYFEKIFPT